MASAAIATRQPRRSAGWCVGRECQCASRGFTCRSESAGSARLEDRRSRSALRSSERRRQGSASSAGPPRRRVTPSIAPAALDAGAAEPDRACSRQRLQPVRSPSPGAALRGGEHQPPGRGFRSPPRGSRSACRGRGRRSAIRARCRQRPKQISPRSWRLAGHAGEHGEGARARPPAASQPEQAAAQERRGEVLLGHRDSAALPAGADLGHRAQHHAFEEAVEREAGQGRVEDRVGAGLVECLERGEQPQRLRGRVENATPGGRARGRPPRPPGRAPPPRPRRCPGRSAGASRARSARRLPSRGGSRRAAHRVEQAVAALPGPDRVGPHTGAPAQLADPDQSFVFRH